MTHDTPTDGEFNPENMNKHIQAIAPKGWDLNPPDFKRVRNWNMLLFQLSTAAATIGILIDTNDKSKLHKDFSQNYALFTSFVLQYSKCFNSVGSDQIKLDANDIFKEAKHLRVDHDEILVIRHKMIAHNDTSKYTRVDISVRELDSGYYVRQAVALSLPRKSYEDWLKLTRYVEQQSIIKLRKDLASLHKRLGKNVYFDESDLTTG